jgi:hypothetical protein
LDRRGIDHLQALYNVMGLLNEEAIDGRRDAESANVS